MMKRVLFMEVVVCLAASAVWPAEFDVTRTDDPPPDGCQLTDCSLREAVIDANAMPGADTIELPAGTYTLTIPPPTGIDEISGDLDITDAVTLSGAGSLVTIIDGGGLDKVFDIRGGVGPVELTGVTIQNGNSSSGGGILLSDFGVLELRSCAVLGNTVINSGGGILVGQDANLLVEDCEISGNTGTGVGSSGGGVFNNGSVLIRRSMIAGNTAASGGGLTNNDLAVEMTIEHSTISGNFALSDFLFQGGGGIINFGNLTVHHSTISDNTATLSDGGGLNVFSGGSAYLWNVTFSGNSAASEGGAIYNSWTVILSNVTIVDNTAADTGGIFTGSTVQRTTEVTTSIVAGNTGGNCSGNVTSEYPNYNLDSGNSCGFAGPGDLINTDPELGPLADNGGPSLTYMPLAGSPVIDGGDPVNGCLDGLGAPLTTDQRGFPRPVDGGTGSAVCDIGSVEFGSSSPGIFSDGFESGKTSAWSSTVP